MYIVIFSLHGLLNHAQAFLLQTVYIREQAKGHLQDFILL